MKENELKDKRINELLKVSLEPNTLYKHYKNGFYKELFIMIISFYTLIQFVVDINFVYIIYFSCLAYSTRIEGIVVC